MQIDGKKQLTIVMVCTVSYANEQSIAENPIAVEFVNWVNSFELDPKEGYMILKIK